MTRWTAASIAGLVIGLLLLSVGVLSFTPSGSCDVLIGVSMTQGELPYSESPTYNITSVSPAVTGYSSVIDWTTLATTFGSRGTPDSLLLTVDVGGHSVSEVTTNDATDWKQSVLIGHVPPGVQRIYATLTYDDASEANLTASYPVGCPL